MYEGLVNKIKDYNVDINLSKVTSAFGFVEKYYKDTDVSIEYPIKVLEILLPMKPDEETIIAVLLHDLFVTGFLSEKHIKEEFGSLVLNMLTSLRSIMNINYVENDNAQIEILRKMFLAMAKDIRVIVVLLACRLCKLKFLDEFPEAKSSFKIAKETMALYVPLASRLGIYRLRTELEDLSFKYLDPVKFKKINDQVQKFGKKRKAALEMVLANLRNFLHSKGLEVFVYGRLKSIYSIYKKLEKKGLDSVDQLFDFYAVRVIIPDYGEGTENNIDRLYGVLGLIHSEWKPVSSRFKDYIAVPKPNGYRSLHTIVLGLTPKNIDQPVEIQIRDLKMHREAEYGIASHWLYKANKPHVNLADHIDWIVGLRNVHNFFNSHSEVMEKVEVDIFKDQIFVLTPRGEVKNLPVGSVPVDFAYAVHTDIGNHCVMAKVNGLMCPLDYELKNGDVVEIITKKGAEPKLRWLSMVKTSFARHRIKSWFSSLNREKNIKTGRDLVNKQLQLLNKPQLDQNFSIFKNYLGEELNLIKREGLIEEIGRGVRMASDVVRKIYPHDRVTRETHVLAHKKSANLILEDQVIVGGERGLPIKIAACCSPTEKDQIIGYVTRNKKISIHTSKCKVLDSFNVEKIIAATWKDIYNEQRKYRKGIKLFIASKIGLVHEISSLIANAGLIIYSVNIHKVGLNNNEIYVLVDFDDYANFDKLLEKLKSLEGIIKITV